MRRVRVIPTLLLSGQKLVKTLRFSSPTYIGDPINALRIFNEKEVDEIVVLDINATENAKGPDYAYIELLTNECFMPLAYGGGVTSLDQAKRIFQLGVEKIIFGSVAFKNPKLIEQVARAVGSQSVVVCVDIKKDWLKRYRVVIASGKENTGQAPDTYIKQAEKMGAGEIFLQSVDRDGTFSGYDLELIRQTTSLVNVPVVAAGGASSVANFVEAIQAGASAVAAGSLFVYKGSRKSILINYPTQQSLANDLYRHL